MYMVDDLCEEVVCFGFLIWYLARVVANGGFWLFAGGWLGDGLFGGR